MEPSPPSVHLCLSRQGSEGRRSGTEGALCAVTAIASIMVASTSSSALAAAPENDELTEAREEGDHANDLYPVPVGLRWGRTPSATIRPKI